MLNLYYGRESIDKDKFIFDRIDKALKPIQQDQRDAGNCPEHKILLLVPDQFTLQAERNAFAYLGVSGLMDLEILSQSRLGFKVLSETGGSKRLHIDKYGRHMLLTKILADENPNLEAFKGMNKMHSFIDMTNNLISEMKQYNTLPEDLTAIIKVTDKNSILHRKLNDIQKIYTKYEELIKGKYIDTEDYLNLFISKISQSKCVKNSEIWVYGFDYFTPKTLDLIEQLLITTEHVNVVMTADESKCRDAELFDLTKGIMFKLRVMAENHGIKYDEIQISDNYKIPIGQKDGEKAWDLAYLEHELFSYPSKHFVDPDSNTSSITLCRAANFYAEAETAAAKIVQLLREEGLRYRDIVVICNDMDARASVIKRVFADYGIFAFLDKKRDILHHPSIEYIDSLMAILTRGWLYEDVFRLLKTNLTPITTEDYEDLENYSVKYRVKGNRWKSEFKYGVKEEGEDALAKINLTRNQILDYISKFEKEFNKGKTVKEKTTILYYFLRDEALLPQKIEELIEYLNSKSLFEYAEETAQIWNVIVGIFDQLIELIGEEELSNEDFSSVLKSGFEAVEIGLLPPTIDQVLVGTMQRTRTGNIKALIVIGANDGLLPSAASTESLLSEDEKALLLNKNIEICKIDNLRVKEEKLAIYKTLSKPTKHLWIGYSASDLEGKESKQSIIFDKIRKIYKNIEVSKDILNEQNPMFRIESPRSTLKHMTEAFRSTMEGQNLEKEWMAAYQWFQSSKEPHLRVIEEGLFFTNKQNAMEKEQIRRLYEREGLKELIISPSRLERFSRCPFAHLINYGLRPEERRIFEIAGREIGDVYHQCLMKLSEQLSIKGIEITAPQSPWMSMTKEDCKNRINTFIDEESKGFKEGVLSQGEEEKYRVERMKEVCGNAAWALVEHVQQGHIQNVYFESEFGKSPEKAFPPIEVKLKDQTVLIEGKIDRVDILNGTRYIIDEDGVILSEEKNQYVKIIDYKSGKEKFDVDEAKAGWRLQLMLYLRAATDREMIGCGCEATDVDGLLKPAGVFYFEIAEPQIDASDLTTEGYQEKIKAELKKSFKLDGILLDNPSIIESIAGEFTGYSEIIPVRKTKEGGFAGTTDKKLLKEEDFSELQRVVDKTIGELCNNLVNGSMDIKPKKVKQETACKFCLYKSICTFDLAFEGCSYDVVK